MTFWDHAEVLRGVLIRIALLLLVLTGILFAAMPTIFDSVILAPCNSDFILYRWLARIPAITGILPDSATATTDVSLINIRLASQFFIHISTSFWLAVILGFPLCVYMLWSFIAPGLYDNEKRGVTTAFIAGNLMFYLGVATGYLLVFPLTLRFLAGYQLSALIPNQISLDSYMDNFMMLILIMGIVFELPILAWLIGKTGLLTRNLFSAYRRHAIVALLILAAVITPTGDPFTLLVVFLPLYLLWELSAYAVPPATPTRQPSSPQNA
ncbi:MAG: twin-arginine translocase subunit TatC [Staphylococcus sp.]|nr:twin-arginine translocase subunit TatC [Staphylococcus sp.]